MVNKELLLSAYGAESSAVSAWLKSGNVFFSSILEENITNRQVLLMAHASLAFSVLIGVSFINTVLALFCLAWFCVSLYLCKKGGLR